MYKRLSSKILLTHPRITVVEDQVELHGGEIGDYIWLDRWLGAVTVIARNSDGRILVQSEYSYLPNTALLQFPGGKLEPDETPEQAANRELAEEVGLHAARLLPLGSFLIDHRRSLAAMHVYIGEQLEARTSAGKDIYEAGMQLQWLTEEEIDELVAGGEIANSVALACWAMYRSKRPQTADRLGA